MRIRPEVLRQLDDLCKLNFEQSLCGFVREKIPSGTSALSQRELRELVLSHISAAREFGLRSQSSIAQFVCLCFLPGPPFYQNPYLGAFLRERGFSPDAKMQCIVDEISTQLRRRKKVTQL